MTQVDIPNDKEEKKEAEQPSTEAAPVDTSAWSRISNYPTVTTLVDTAKTYYAAAKDASPATQFVGEKLEATVQGSLQWVTPKVEPVLQTELYQKLATTVDDTMNKGLDILENKVEQVKGGIEHKAEQINQVKANIGEKVEAVKATTYTAIEGADKYLKDSLVAKPLTAALNVTENYIGRDEPESNDGPIFQAARVSKKIQREAFAKLKGLSLRTPEEIGVMQYTVDLIQYAATALDNGVNVIGGKIHQGVDGLKEGAHYAYEAPKKLSKEAKQKFLATAHDAVEALSVAAHNIETQLPEPITTRVKETAIVLKHTAEGAKLRAKGDLVAFHNLASKGYDTLQELRTTLSGYVTKGEQVPAQLLHSATTRINEVLGNLVTFLNDHTTLRKDAPTETPTETPKESSN